MSIFKKAKPNLVPIFPVKQIEDSLNVLVRRSNELLGIGKELEARIDALEASGAGKIVNPKEDKEERLIAAVEQAEAALAEAIAFFKARTGEVKK